MNVQRRPDFWLLTGSHAVNDFYQGSVPAILPFLVAERGYSYAAATGITVAATALSSVVQPGFGHLADRFRLGWMIAVGMLVAGIGIGLSGVGQAYILTWLSIALAGIGIAAYHPPAAQAARAVGRGSSRVLGIFQVGGTIGGATAPLVVAAVLGATGVSGTWLLAIPAVAMFALYGYAMPRLRPAVASAVGESSSSTVPAGVARPDDWRAFRVLVAVVVCWSITYVGTTSFVALSLIHHFDVSKGTASLALTTFIAAGAVGTYGGGLLADRWGRVRTIRAGYALALPAAAVVVAAPGLIVSFVAIAVLGMAIFTPFAAQITLGQDYLPNRIATASGVTLGLSGSVGGLLAPAFGALADARGLTVTMAALLSFVGVALVFAMRLRDRTPVEHRPADVLVEATDPAGSDAAPPVT